MPKKIKKKEIRSGYYTKGGEFAFENGIDYIGPYFYFRTVIFSGTGPKDEKNPVERLLRYPSIPGFPNKSEVNPPAYYYESIVKKPFSRKLLAPRHTMNRPTEKDYEKTFYTRYFIKVLSSQEIMELDKAQFKYYGKKNNLILSLYKTISVDWKIVGPSHDQRNAFGTIIVHGVIDTNQRSAAKANSELDGMYLYLGNQPNGFTNFARVQ